MTPKYAAKLVVVGDNAVGKTSLIKRFVDRNFTEDYLPTIGTNIFMKRVELGDALVNLSIYDIAGQEKWRKVRRVYYEGARMAFLVGDLTRQSTFVQIRKSWGPDVQAFAADIPVVVLANKADLTREVDAATVQATAEAVHASAVFETSAKTGQAVDLAFRTIVGFAFQELEL